MPIGDSGLTMRHAIVAVLLIFMVVRLTAEHVPACRGPHHGGAGPSLARSGESSCWTSRRVCFAERKPGGGHHHGSPAGAGGRGEGGRSPHVWREASFAPADGSGTLCCDPWPPLCARSAAPQHSGAQRRRSALPEACRRERWKQRGGAGPAPVWSRPRPWRRSVVVILEDPGRALAIAEHGDHGLGEQRLVPVVERDAQRANGGRALACRPPQH